MNRLFEQMSELGGVHRQFEKSFQGAIDASAFVPKLEFPKLLNEELLGSLSKAATTSRLFEQMSELGGVHRQFEKSFQGAIDASAFVPKLEFPKLLSEELLAELRLAAERLRVSLPDQESRELLDSALESETHDEPDFASCAGVLVLACVGVACAIDPKVGLALGRLFEQAARDGAFVAETLASTYEHVSRTLPDTTAVTWGFLFLEIWARLRDREPPN